MEVQDAAPRLAVTKFGPPAAPRTLVPRDQHVEALDRLAGQHPVTVVAAPAGAGKTVLLGEWVRRCPEGSWAWLSCDVTDTDTTRFWASVLTACGHLGGAGEEARVLLAEDPDALDEVVPSLVNDLATLDQRAVLVIDDLHLVPSEGVAPLGLLVERLPPAVAIVVGTRSDPPLPLHRWRVEGILGEFRSDQLRFSARDTGRIVAAHGVELAPADATTLTERTEGWAAGVQLAALTLRDHPDPPAFVRAFAGSHHNVTDYLAGEVLRQLDPDTLDFLLATATLDEFDAERCRALTGRDDAADRLVALEAANLFVVRVGTDPDTYRLHHLFRDALRGWLSARDPDRVRALNASASSWYEQQGDVARAIRHAIDGRDADRAFALVGEHALSGYLTGDAGIGSWITQLGDEVLSASSDQVLDYVVALILAGRMEDAGRWLAHLDATAPADPSPRFAARHAISKAYWHGTRGEVDAARAYAEHAVGQVAPGDDPFVDTAPLALIRVHDYLDRPADARAVFRDAVDRWALNPLTREVSLEGAIAAAELESGNLGLAGELTRRAEAAARRLGAERHLVACDVMRTLGALEAEAGDLTTAERNLEAALDIATPGRPNFALLSLVELARVAARHGELDEAFDRLDRGRAFLPPGLDSPLLVRVDALRVRIRTGAGLEVTADELEALGSGPRRALADAQHHLQQRDPAAAARSLEALAPATEPRPQLERDLVAAQIALIEGDANRLDDHLDAIIDLSRTQGFARSITDAGREITRALGARLRRAAPEPALDALERAVAEASRRPVPADRTGSADKVGLTDREHTVLRHLPTRLSNRELAAELYVSLNTLKTHLRSMYGKLGVDSRAEAVSRATDLGLL